jgi:hypothetical protein
MTIIVQGIENPVYGNVEQTVINCMVKFAHLAEPVPFSAREDDAELHGRLIFAACVQAGNIGAYVPPAESLTALREIEHIERGHPITHRGLRELILVLGELNPAGKNTVFYQRAKEADDLIKIERAKL